MVNQLEHKLEHQKDWYKELVIYQIYPRSFLDTNGDGVGDLNGVYEKLDYLQELGINAIWLSPVYKSPNVDNGYDVSDYRAIMDEFGTFADWERLRDGCHERGIHVIMDLVLNHTSDMHEWFRQSRRSKENPYSDYYIWRDPIDGGRPNNWESVFGGSAWEFCPERGQYYLHLFAKEQPDLNWENDRLREEIFALVRWWMEQGVDGFRVDAISYLQKPDGLPNSQKAPTGPDGLVVDMELCSNLPLTHAYIHMMNEAAFQPYHAMSVGEVFCDSPDCAWEFVSSGRREFDMIIPFVSPIEEIQTWSPKAMKRNVAEMYTRLKEDGWWARFFSNHDKPRQVSLYGDDGQYWEESAKMLASLLHTLPGTPFIYQGEEIGMTNIRYPCIDRYDDIDTRNFYHKLVQSGTDPKKALQMAQNISRDNARSPMQWDASQSGGFTTATPWLAVNPNYRSINVAEQRGRDRSIFRHYQTLIRMRKEHPVMIYGDYTPLFEEQETLFAYLRSHHDTRWLIIHNFSREQTTIELTPEYANAAVLLSNYSTDCLSPGKNLLRPYESLILALNK